MQTSKKMFGFLLTLHMLYNGIAQTANFEVASADRKHSKVERTYIYMLGNRQIAIRKISYGNKVPVVMINLHDDETTGVEAAGKVLEKTGGILLSIENNGERLISFTKYKRTFRFDPNRMFTRAGIRASLLEQNKYNGDLVVETVYNFARFCLRKIPSSHTLIALHNNRERGLSVLSYLEGGDLQLDASAVNKNDSHDPDNFYLTTDDRLFQHLKAAGYNVVLQNNKKATDDGSLSIYYGKKNKRYINIEAKTGMVTEQREMIEAAAGIIQTFTK
jgi:hypothetical protein